MNILGLIVPILALMIPISAIIMHSPVGKAWARRLEQGTLPVQTSELEALNQRVLALETRFAEQSIQIQQLQESSDFYQDLLEQPASSPGLKPNLN